MTLSKRTKITTPFPKIVAIVLFVALPFVGFFLGERYQLFLDNATNIKNTASESCAKAGERAIDNFDMTKGKRDLSIKVKKCCPGLEAIGDKQETLGEMTPGVCAQLEGKAYDLCSPCGNGVCDSQYEDSCNCPEDCK